MAATNPLNGHDRRHHVHGQTDLRRYEEQSAGVYIRTADGREMIDGSSGLGCTPPGYPNERLAAAANKRMDTLPSARTFYGRSPPKVAELAERLLGIAAVPFERVTFQCSGSEAKDAMIDAAQADIALARILRQHPLINEKSEIDDAVTILRRALDSVRGELRE